MLKSNWSELLKYKEQKDQICDTFAVVLREISLAAWNNEKDKATAVAANNWALEYATGGELLARLNQDRQTLADLPTAAIRVGRECKTWVARGFSSLWSFGVIVICKWQKQTHRQLQTARRLIPAVIHSARLRPTQQPSSYGNTYRVPSTIASELSREAQQ